MKPMNIILNCPERTIAAFKNYFFLNYFTYLCIFGGSKESYLLYHSLKCQKDKKEPKTAEKHTPAFIENKKTFLHRCTCKNV